MMAGLLYWAELLLPCLIGKICGKVPPITKAQKKARMKSTRLKSSEPTISKPRLKWFHCKCNYQLPARPRTTTNIACDRGHLYKSVHDGVESLRRSGFGRLTTLMKSNVCYPVQDGVEKLKHFGFGSLIRGDHKTHRNEKRHDWYAFSSFETQLSDSPRRIIKSLFAYKLLPLLEWAKLSFHFFC